MQEIFFYQTDTQLYYRLGVYINLCFLKKLVNICILQFQKKKVFQMLFGRHLLPMRDIGTS